MSKDNMSYNNFVHVFYHEFIHWVSLLTRLKPPPPQQGFCGLITDNTTNQNMGFYGKLKA